MFRAKKKIFPLHGTAMQGEIYLNMKYMHVSILPIP